MCEGKLRVAVYKRERIKRVAAYVCVATDGDPRFGYALQVEHYTRRIQENPAWEFVGVYGDKGAGGPIERDGFNRMLREALNGKIDMILTKSVSRFARNTADLLAIIRQLAENGVAVFFEAENFNTLDQGETARSAIRLLEAEHRSDGERRDDNDE